jgi:hypothetical protein
MPLASGHAGLVHVSEDGWQDIVEGPALFASDLRRSAVIVDGDRLYVLLSNVGIILNGSFGCGAISHRAGSKGRRLTRRRP